MNKGVVIFTILGVVLLAIASYFIFFKVNVCSDSECFSEAIVSCEKTIYLFEDEDMIKQYVILGEQNEQCSSKVKILQIKTGNMELEILEGQEMICSFSQDTLIMPDEDITKCHGLLRENIQELVIQRMHKQLIANIGQIDESINKI